MFDTQYQWVDMCFKLTLRLEAFQTDFVEGPLAGMIDGYHP